MNPYGSIDRLEALGQGYFGLNNVFVINIVLAVASNALLRTSKDLTVVGIVVLVMFVLIAALTFPHNKNIAYGKGWANSAAILASVLMGLNSALCCGIVGYVVMQTIASKELAKYGITGGLFGIKKKVFQEEVARRKAAAAGAPVYPGP